MPTARIAPSPKAIRQPQAGSTIVGSSSGMVSSEPSVAPTQNEPLIATSTRPRYFAGISSSIAELMAAYSPPMPAPVRNLAAEVPHRGHRERRQHGGDRVDGERDQEQLLPAEPVGELAEEQRAQTGAGDVDRAGHADVGAAEAQAGVGRLQRLGHRADDGDLEPVEDPHGPQADDDHPVPACPWQPVHACRNVGGDASGLDGHDTRLSARASRRCFPGQPFDASGGPGCPASPLGGCASHSLVEEGALAPVTKPRDWSAVRSPGLETVASATSSTSGRGVTRGCSPGTHAWSCGRGSPR